MFVVGFAMPKSDKARGLGFVGNVRAVEANPEPISQIFNYTSNAEKMREI